MKPNKFLHITKEKRGKRARDKEREEKNINHSKQILTYTLTKEKS